MLAIDAPDAKNTAAGSTFGRTVTLDVTSAQAEKINVATELGKLSLILRSASGRDGLASTALHGAAGHDCLAVRRHRYIKNRAVSTSYSAQH